MNLKRVRVTLTLWYMFVLIGIVVLITVPAYLLLTQKLGEESDETLYSSALGIAGQIDADFANQTRAAPAQSNDPFQYLSGNRGDFFYAVLSADGTPILNPLGIDLNTFIDLPAIHQATDEGSAWRTVSTSGDSYRVLLFAVDRSDAPNVFVAVGRSDSEHQRELDLVLLFIAGSGVIGLLLALAGGWYLGGRALAPARIAFERQKEFVADASHELRTPLTVIRTNAEAIARYGGQSLAKADRQALDDIIAESSRMGDLVEDLLTLARVDAEDVSPQNSEFDLVELVEESIRYFQPLTAAKSLSLMVSAPASIRVHSNEIAVSRVLRILLENAVQYSSEHGEIAVRCSEDGRRAVVQVRDSGPGIEPHALNQVFDRFYRSDAARGRRGGSGLGLAIARTLLNELGGEIKAANVPGQGAIFTFSVPLVALSR